jgi:hypothetical protein
MTAVIVRLLPFPEAYNPQRILAFLRSRVPEQKVVIACDRPTTQEEQAYLQLFEEFHPEICYDGSLDSLAVDISWAQKGYDLGRLRAPAEGALQPMCLEKLEALCDYSIYTREVAEYTSKWIHLRCAADRLLLVEDTDWPAAACSARTIHVHADLEAVTRFISHEWPALRLAIISESDETIPHEMLAPFLERHPNLYIWATNNKEYHPRIRTLPIFLENRQWRNLRRKLPAEEHLQDTPIEIHRRGLEERDYTIGLTQCWPTNPIRPIWTQYIYDSCRGNPDFMVFPKVDSDTFLENIESCRAVICPPGNGVDTHRHWETLLTGGYAIVQKNGHTENLLREYPSLPLLPIERIEDVLSVSVPAESPSPFHPLLLFEFWRVLFESHLA